MEARRIFQGILAVGTPLEGHCISLSSNTMPCFSFSIAGKSSLHHDDAMLHLQEAAVSH